MDQPSNSNPEARTDRDGHTKHWCFTINNPTDEDRDRLASESFRGHTQYGVYGDEVAPTTGTPHLQGFVSFEVKKRCSAVSKLIPRAACYAMYPKSTPTKAANYCKKDRVFVEWGIIPLTGPETVKKDWEEARKLALANEVSKIDASIYIPYYNTLNRIASDHAPKVASIPELTNEWHYGPTGTYKSKTVREGNPDAFIKEADKWWDGYQGEDVVIVEDVDIYDVKLGRQLKLWGDHYSFSSQGKHQGKKDIRPKKIIITSNYHPKEIWADPKTWQPILRRYTLIKYTADDEVDDDRRRPPLPIRRRPLV